MMEVLQPLGQVLVGVVLVWFLVVVTVVAIDVLIILILAAGDFIRDVHSKTTREWKERKRARGAR